MSNQFLTNYRLSLFCVFFNLGAIFQLHTFLSPVIKPEREETMNKEISSVGARIRECRKEIGYSQETLAAMLYMKKTTICKYEKDLHDIPSSVLVELAKKQIALLVQLGDSLS